MFYESANTPYKSTIFGFDNDMWILIYLNNWLWIIYFYIGLPLFIYFFLIIFMAHAKPDNLCKTIYTYPFLPFPNNFSLIKSYILIFLAFFLLLLFVFIVSISASVSSVSLSY